jgi:long-subunit acyl-CoA synthetase (AMP-forming)
MTSGSKTGWGRVVVQSRPRLEAAAKGLISVLGCKPQEVWLGVLPEHHVAGLAVRIRSEVSSGTVIRFEELDQKGWSAKLFSQLLIRSTSRPINWLSLVPAQLHDLVQAQVTAPTSLRGTLVGAGHLTDDLARRASALGWRPRATYASTEAGATVALGPEGLGGDALRFRFLPHIKGYQTRSGTLGLSGESVALGRIDIQTQAWTSFDGAYDTGDHVELTDQGHEFRLIGRVDQRVKILGETVDLAELRESFQKLCAQNLDAGLEAELLAVRDPRAGAKLVALFAGREALSLERQASAVLAAFQDLARPFERIQHSHFLESVPRSDLGKPLWSRALIDLGYQPLADEVRDTAF